MMNAAIMGYGTIGSGVAEILEKNKETIRKAAGQEIALKYVLDLREFPGSPVEDKVIHDFSVIEQDPEVELVVEAMGGLNPAYPFVKACLLAGKHVATSNKALVAAYGSELLEIAREKQVNFFFEASVGGGIPIIRPMNYSLTAEAIDGITGILNGTTNYILTKMEREGADFGSVLQEAQEKGYAEKNPEADVEGYDACRKIAILSSLMLGKTVNYENIYTEGITKITAEDFRYAKALDQSIKLLAVSKMTEEGCMVMVAPFMIPAAHALHGVNDVYNAVYVHSNMLGNSMYYGRGAGKLPTASAVVSDVVDCARHQGKTVMCFWDEEEVELADYRAFPRRFFVRADAGLLDEEKAESLFGTIETIRLENMPGEFGFLTGPMKETDFEAAKNKAQGILGRIRLEDWK